MSDRCAVVTGASGTLGASVVRLLAGRGLSVLAVSRSGRSPGSGEAAAIAADLGDDTAIAAIRDALPPGDLAMAVHAVGLPSSPGVMEVDPRMLGVAADLKAGGFLRLVRAVDDRVGRGSRLVAIGGHLGSEPSEHAPLPGVGNAALASVVRQLAHPIGRRGASVHLVAPAPFDSPRTAALIAAKARGDGVSEDEVRQEMTGNYPGGHLPSADDVAGVIVSLLEPHADVLNGSTLSADGGLRRGIF